MNEDKDEKGKRTHNHLIDNLEIMIYSLNPTKQGAVNCEFFQHCPIEVKILAIQIYQRNRELPVWELKTYDLSTKHMLLSLKYRYR